MNGFNGHRLSTNPNYIVEVKPQRNRLRDMVKQLLQNLKRPNPLKGLRDIVDGDKDKL